MDTITFGSWSEFRSDLLNYASQPRARRDQLLFRGHASTTWTLQTTLDRQQKFDSDFERDRHVKSLLEEFRREAMRLRPEAAHLPAGEALELLARHHGLPSPLLDWSGSPYTAAFFALDGASESALAPVAVWRLDRAKLPAKDSGIDLIDDQELLRFNMRALQQRGVFVRVSTIRRPVEDLLGDSLTKIEIPAAERKLALADLDEMGINSTNLMYDLNGAASTARSRILG
jgi:hypothetical protein